MKALSCTTTICFNDDQVAQVVEIEVGSNPTTILDSLSLTPFPNGVILISGGADDYPPHAMPQTKRAIETVMCFAFENHTLIVDGGTDRGVMKVIGEEFMRLKCTRQAKCAPPLIGFVPAFMVTYPKAPHEPRCSKPAKLDENHPYFVLVHGPKDWGGEVESMFAFAGLLSDKMPSVAIIANGGGTTLREAAYSAKQGRDLIILEGSERATQVIIDAMEGKSEAQLAKALYETKTLRTSDSKKQEKLKQALNHLREIAHYDKITRIGLDDPPEKLSSVLSIKLKPS